MKRRELNRAAKAIISSAAICLVLMMSGPATSAQARKADKIYTEVQQLPEFPGGVKGFTKYLAADLKYPAKAVTAKVQGKVFVTFVVEKNGSVGDIKVKRGIGHGCDEEAVRVIAKSPKWTPGKQNGKVVRTQFTVPINFALKA